MRLVALWYARVSDISSLIFEHILLVVVGHSSGYSSKPDPYGAVARALSGENGRPLGSPEATLGTAGEQYLRCAPAVSSYYLAQPERS